MKGFENFIGFNPWTALFTLLNMVITFLILKKFLFKPVNKMIGDRQKEIDDIYSEAEKTKAEAEQMKADYDGHLLQAKSTSDEIIQTARQEAFRQSEEILHQARSEAEDIRDKAMSDVELEKKKAVNEVKDDISRLALEIAEKVVERELDASDEDRLFEEFLEKMGDHV